MLKILSKSSRHLIPAAILSATIVLQTQVANALTACFADWSEASPVVSREGLKTIEHVSRLARDRASVEIVNSALCRDESRFVYRLLVRGAEGRLTLLIVDALKPFDR